MPDYKLTEAAKMDLRGIGTYTNKAWGPKQEKAYREILRAALRMIAKAPEMRQKRDELAVGLRSFPVGHHIAYYVEKGDAIEVARILHPAMDREKALQK